MISNPSNPVLEGADIEAARLRLGGGRPTWLEPGIAAEFAVPEKPEALHSLRKELDLQSIDIGVVPAGNRRKRLLLADMDSTIIQQEGVDEIARMSGCGDEVSRITDLAMRGDIPFREALMRRVKLFRGKPASILERVWKERIEMTPGAATLAATMRGNGAHCIIVSGGFTAISERVADALGFHEHFAHILEISDNLLTGRVCPPLLGRVSKVEILQEKLEALDIDRSDVLAVGDGSNDLGMIELAGLGVSYRGKPILARNCDIQINHGDLTALLYLQGYKAAEFRTCWS